MPKRKTTLKVVESDGDDSTPTKSPRVEDMIQRTPRKTGKRTNYLSWDEYFMSVAFLSAQRSKDPNSQVGACVVNGDRKIVGIGYNGMPNGCSDDELPWSRVSENELDTKYPYVCHAEMNAILNKNSADLKGCFIYVALFPCNECTKLIIQAGIKEVIYYSDKYHNQPQCKASRKLLDLARVNYRQFKPKTTKICIDFTSIDGPLSRESWSVSSP